MNLSGYKTTHFFIKMIITHTVTYMVIGLMASTIFNYAEMFADQVYQGYMRQLNDPIVMAGPLFQPIRGLIFALVLLPFSRVLLEEKRGWLYLWGLLVGIGILSTFGPAPGSIEGMIYSNLPVGLNPGGYVEVLLQSLLLSVIFIYWVKHPEQKWISWVMGVLFVLLITMITLGLVLAT